MNCKDCRYHDTCQFEDKCMDEPWKEFMDCFKPYTAPIVEIVRSVRGKQFLKELARLLNRYDFYIDLFTIKDDPYDRSTTFLRITDSQCNDIYEYPYDDSSDDYEVPDELKRRLSMTEVPS